MEILYCSRCNHAIPPGGLDEGRYFKLGEDLICPKCYHKAKADQHSGNTVPVDPVKDGRLLGASRVTAPAEDGRPSGSRVGPAVKGRKITSSATMPAVGQRRMTSSAAMRAARQHTPAEPTPAHRQPSTKKLPAAAPSSSTSSARLRSIRESNARMRLLLGLLLLAASVGTAAVIFFWTMRTKPGTGPGTSGPTPRPGGATMGGTGTGLRGEYFNGTNFGHRVFERVDPKVDFEFSGSPGKGLNANSFSVRWTGQIEPEHSETYSFATMADDGVRLWVDGQLLIDDWRGHAPEERSGAISLQAGRRYKLQLDYYNGAARGMARLFWSSPSTPRQPVPSSRLYPAAPGDQPAPGRPEPPTAPQPQPGRTPVPAVPSVAGLTTVVLQDGQNGYDGTRDAWVAGPPNNKDANYGVSEELNTGDMGGPCCTLIRFAIFRSEGGPVPDGADVRSTTLSLYRKSGYAHQYDVRRVLREWREAEVTWERAGSAASWQAVGAGGGGTDVAAEPDALVRTGEGKGWQAFDVTAGVKAFAGGARNHGWRLFSADAVNYNSHASREHKEDASLRPKLTVVFAAPSGK
ncbi:MAG TPA: PA14 domain-containing protein [Planctomycetota bacterium]|nr:PA14 domain-containing protein [Planctomycetota bacterium]